MSDEAKPTDKTTEPLDQGEIHALLLKKLQQTMEAGFTGIRADFSVLTNDFGVLRDRVILGEKRLDDLEKRSGMTSERVRGESKTNEDQNGVIGTLVADVAQAKADLAAAKADIASVKDTIGSASEFRKLLVDTTKEAIANPMVKKLGLALVGLALQAIAAGTTYLALKGH